MLKVFPLIKIKNDTSMCSITTATVFQSAPRSFCWWWPRHPLWEVPGWRDQLPVAIAPCSQVPKPTYPTPLPAIYWPLLPFFHNNPTVLFNSSGIFTIAL